MSYFVKTLVRITPFVVISIILGLVGTSPVLESAQASTTSPTSLEQMITPVSTGDIADEISISTMAYFAKYGGIDGESTDDNHDKWIDILSIDWGVHQPTAGASGMARRRGSAEVDDMVITFLYEKSAPKLAEKCLMGAVIPRLEIELTADFGGARATYLRYEFKNVMVTSYDVSGNVADGVPPTVTVANNFEEIRVTYSEYAPDGSHQGNVEFEWKVEEGE